MLFNARSAAASIENVAGTLQVVSEDQTGDMLKCLDQRALFNELQNVIVQAAALSRYFCQ